MFNEIGVRITYRKETDLVERFQKAKQMEFDSCQLCVWDESLLTSDSAKYVKNSLTKVGFKISALWAGWGGPCEWNFSYGPSTIGLVPTAYRAMRLEALKKASDFAEMIGVDKMVTHVGFIPENADDPNFNGVVGVLKNLCRYMKVKGQSFLFETGQETPVTLLRTIQAIEMDNVGINLDTANLVLYGKGNTLDSLDVFGKYVCETHIKDGFYPTDGMALGKEVAAGEGKAQLPLVIKKLGELGYSGTYTIEREITGEQQTADIIKARDLIREWMKCCSSHML